MINIRKLEAELWESADLLRAGSKLTSNQYCMPVLGLIFLRYAYSRFKLVEAEILKDRPVRGGRVLPVEASDFASVSYTHLSWFAICLKFLYTVCRLSGRPSSSVNTSSSSLCQAAPACRHISFCAFRCVCNTRITVGACLLYTSYPQYSRD